MLMLCRGMPVLTDWMWRLGIDAPRRPSVEQGARRPSGDHAGSEQVSRRSSGDRVRRNMQVIYRSKHALPPSLASPQIIFKVVCLVDVKLVMLLALHAAPCPLVTGSTNRLDLARRVCHDTLLLFFLKPSVVGWIIGTAKPTCVHAYGWLRR